MLGKKELETKMASAVGLLRESAPDQQISYAMVFDICADVALREFKKERPITMNDLKKMFQEITSRHLNKNDYISRADIMVMLSCVEGIES